MDLSNLNPSQREAVLHPASGGGPLLVLAGAGSGKTKTLTYRVAHLLEQGIKPEQLLVLTFTNKAADEMKERISSLLASQPESAKRIIMGTFHSICAQFLRRDAMSANRRPSFSIYDRDDQLRLLKLIIKNLDISTDILSPYAALNKIQEAKNNLLDEDACASQAQSDFDRLMSHIYQQYQTRLQEANAFDFDDLITQFVFLLEANPAALKKYQARFSHILVDEYQDTNAAQYRLIRLLAQKHGNLFLVADDWQSIYSFRNADISNVLNFQRDWPEAKIILLEENYRSTKTILSAAQGLIEHNEWQMKKQLWTKNPAGVPITIKECLTEAHEAEFVVKTIKKSLLEKGVLLSDIAIFFRTNLQSRPLEETLIKQGLAYQTHGLIRFYDRKEIKDILAYLRILENPLDSVSLSRIINVPARGIGPKAVKSILAYKTAFETYEISSELKDRLGRAGLRAFEEFLGLCKRLKSALTSYSLGEFLPFLMKQTGYDAFIGKDAASEERKANLEELTHTADRFSGRANECLTQFLERTALFSEEKEAQGKGLHIMTVHAAKGLEFPIVFITGLEWGVFPHYKSIDSQKALEEERRLCYVAMTRAKERLFLSYAQQRRLYGRAQANPPSEFLNEIPPEFVSHS